MRIDGRQIAQEIFENLKKKVTDLKSRGITPHLAIILVGNDPASVMYVSRKVKKAEEIGAAATVIRFESRITNQELRETIEKLNNDTNVHGIIVQRPLPQHIDSDSINNAVIEKKDIDAFHPDSPYEMPLAAAVIEIIENIYSVISSTSERSLTSFEKTTKWLQSKNIVVIGKGETGGGPVITMMRKMKLTPLIIDSKTPNSPTILKTADIIVSTVGKSGVVKPEDLKPGVILVGVGMHTGSDGKLHGDYNEEEIKDIASFYTPIPGGVGPVNVAMLLKNLVLAASQ